MIRAQCLGLGFAAALAAGATAAIAAPAPAAPAYTGEMRAFAFNFCPQGWLPADGRVLSVAQNQALFSLIGTTYGGNGVSNFALPDLRGRTPAGSATGLPLGGVAGAPASGPTPRFLGMTWCIAVSAATPPHGARTQAQR